MEPVRATYTAASVRHIAFTDKVRGSMTRSHSNTPLKLDPTSTLTPEHGFFSLFHAAAQRTLQVHAQLSRRASLRADRKPLSLPEGLFGARPGHPPGSEQRLRGPVRHAVPDRPGERGGLEGQRGRTPVERDPPEAVALAGRVAQRASPCCDQPREDAGGRFER